MQKKKKYEKIENELSEREERCEKYDESNEV